MFNGAFSFLQKVGKGLMLPVAVLPVAGLLLGIGAANFSWLPESVSALLRESGGVIFGTMPLLFAIAVALGFTNNDGVAAVAAAVSYGVLLATMGVMAKVFGVATVSVMGITSMQTGVFGGILAGAVAAAMYNRFYKIDLPPWLGFFAGKRFVPIITALCAIGLGIALSVAWPPVQRGIDTFSRWAAVSDPRLAATLYGFVERMLVPFGLHHIWNAPFFYEIGSFVDANGVTVRGDIQRYFAGDPTAGILSGAYLFKMFGLPAAAMAIWREAPKEKRAQVGGIMLSGALTSFLTGITEPIEFSFLFVAPGLYALHAVLVASAQFVMSSLDVHMGFTFSQGGIDYVLFNVLNPHSQRWWLVLVLGPVYAAVYFVAFRAAIRWFNLKTLGREPPEEALAPLVVSTGSRAQQLVEAFGGRENLETLDACVTRLRISVREPRRVDEARLKGLGASGVLVMGTGVQAVFGPLSENLKTEMQEHLAATGGGVGAGPAPQAPAAPARPQSANATEAETAKALLAALGGRANVKSIEAIALTRLRVELLDAGGYDEKKGASLGVQGVLRAGPQVLHLLLGEAAPRLATALASH